MELKLHKSVRVYKTFNISSKDQIFSVSLIFVEFFANPSISRYVKIFRITYLITR